MSHVIDYQPDSIDQKIRDVNALQLCTQFSVTKTGEPALQLKLMPGAVIGADGLVYRDGKLVTKGVGEYRTWKNDHGGRLVGDYPTPKGMTTAEVGYNAVATISLTNAAKKELGGNQGSEPYEVGVIPHLDAETGEMIYSLTHDFFGSGYGLERYVGETKINYGKGPRGEGSKVTEAHGLLTMYYQLAVAKMAAEEAGHSFEAEKNDDGSYTAYVDRENVGVQA